MYFKLRDDARSWFSKLCKSKLGDKEPFTTAFDFYYLCALAGIAGGKPKTPPDGWSQGAGDLVDYFPAEYKSHRGMIIGLLLTAELARMGIETTEKEEVKAKLNDIIDPDSPSKLSDSGVRRLNEYSSGGYELLVEKLGRKPEFPEDFLLDCREEINIAIEENMAW